MNSERLPPHDVDAEEAVIGSLLIDGAAINKIVTFLQPPDFYREQNQWLYGACFSLYQRNPINGTYDQYPTANPDTCKLVQLSWICSRNILGKKANTESVQSAKVVIRKQ